MNDKIQSFHQQKMALIYLRQSTMHQVMHNQESTNRQYALEQKALQYGWDQTRIRIMDGDLGQSGNSTSKREDFKLLVAEVSMDKVGAIFVLEASRLSRSSADWNRLLELCALTQTLIIDQDGCYDPAQFNDQLLLGLKGTMSQAELHLIRARLYGAKLNKAKRGELRLIRVILALIRMRRFVIQSNCCFLYLKKRKPPMRWFNTLEAIISFFQKELTGVDGKGS